MKLDRFLMILQSTCLIALNIITLTTKFNIFGALGLIGGIIMLMLVGGMYIRDFIEYKNNKIKE